MNESISITKENRYPVVFRRNESGLRWLDGSADGVSPASTQGRPPPISGSDFPPQASQARKGSVPPIRSLSVRQHPLYPSTANLRSENDQGPPNPVTPAPSATIAKTIQRLETLLDEAEQITRMVLENSAVSSESPKRSQVPRTVRPSAGIRLRAASIIQKPTDTPVNVPVTPAEGDGSIPLGQNEEHNRAAVAHHVHASDALRPCGPGHELAAGNKSLPAPVSLSTAGEDFELKPVLRMKSNRTRFMENLEPKGPAPASMSLKDPRVQLSRRRSTSSTSLSRRDIKQHIRTHNAPAVTPRTTSVRVRDFGQKDPRTYAGLPPALKRDVRQIYVIDEDKNEDMRLGVTDPRSVRRSHFSEMFGLDSRQGSIDLAHPPHIQSHKIDLKGHRHIDLSSNMEPFDIHESCHHAPVARDWPSSRKRFAATIACINTACLGVIIGIYAGEVPAIQYVIADFHHYTILGNVVFYSGLAVPTLFLWPLPLLHGRKPYTVIALALALCLQIPQGISVGSFRSPDVGTYRIVLLLARAASGFVLGFANINFQAALLDLFGASLQSNEPHQEAADPYDSRRHGGGMGLWLGVWSWCSIGPISVGFVIGAFIISSTNVAWGFWTCLLILMCILLLNIIVPEIRRSAFRRTISEIQGEGGGFSRVARGEVKMHLKATGPYWWGEEVKAGAEMCWLMVKQPGFLILSVYAAWVYAQFTMVMMFLGALASTYYMYRPIEVGLCVLSLALGAGIATPFQKASWFSRARSHPPRTNSMSFRKPLSWSSHLLRRTLFTVILPLAAIGYTLTLRGPPFPVFAPCLFAGVVGFASNMAIAECFGLIMETFDTSDLQAGMTGRPARRSAVEKLRGQRTNFSCYPRVSAGFAVTQSLKFILGAAATGTCGRLERRVGAMRATAIVAGALLVLTALVTIVLYRWKTVKMIPDLGTMVEQVSRRDTDWEPVILGKPSGTMRKISILEAGRQTRWSEIRRRNRVGSGLTGS